MAKQDEKNYGNVYEIKLRNDKYCYICWIRELNFGVFDYYSDNPTDDMDFLLSVGIKIYKSSKETAIRKKIWRWVGRIDLEKENMFYPDLVIFMPYNKDYFIEKSEVMRNGNICVVPQENYLSLLKKGYIYGFFDNYQNFELWLMDNIENYPENEDI